MYNECKQSNNMWMLLLNICELIMSNLVVGQAARGSCMINASAEKG